MYAPDTPRFHRSIELNSDKCLKSTRVIKINTSISYCLDCFAKLNNSSSDYELISTHHITNAIFEPPTCLVCQCNLIQIRLIHVCDECVRSYLKLMKSLARTSINAYEVEYRVNVRNDRVESLKIL